MKSDETQNDRGVFLGMPGYGDLTIGASVGLFGATSGQVSIDGEPVKLTAHRDYAQGSLLGHVFNRLWCGAGNRALSGERVDYFAMIHSDIEPERHWLDKLITEMEARDLDVLGVVVPIKSTHGLTSIALDKPGQQWHPLCRLTMKEVYDLPETFTEDDTGHPILINTGLWVCRFSVEICKQLHFTINDRVSFDDVKGEFVPEVEPEDWFFSRRCHELGLRVGATRKVKLLHAGNQRFSNEFVWGDQKFDTEFVDQSVVPVYEQSDAGFPRDVDGWLMTEEGLALAELADGKQVLEIGSYCGRSTVCMAKTAAHVTACDYFDGRGTPRPQNTLAIFNANIERYGLADKVTTHHPDDELPEEEFDLVFIDGAHDYESVAADIRKALLAIKTDGLLAFHDYRVKPGEFDSGWDPGVTQAVNELIADGGELLARHATVAVVRPPALIPLEV